MLKVHSGGRIPLNRKEDEIYKVGAIADSDACAYWVQLQWKAPHNPTGGVHKICELKLKPQNNADYCVHAEGGDSIRKQAGGRKARDGGPQGSAQPARKGAPRPGQ